MMKKFGVIIIFLIAFVYWGAINTSSQSPPVQASQSWKCLKGTPVQYSGTANTSLTEELVGEGFPLDTYVYIVSCVGTGGGAICTTTNSAYDQLIFRADNTSRFPFTVSITGGSKHRVPFGKLKTTVTVPTSHVTGLISFYSITIADPQTVKGSQRSIQQGTFALVDSSVTSCASISWTIVPPPAPTDIPIERCHDSRENEETEFCRRNDPFGFVFDSQSLEPIPNAQVTVLNKDKKKYELLGLTNPQTTGPDGLFNFLVEPGTYYLTVVPPKGYVFTANPNLHPNYKKIYYKIDGSSSIYRPDEPIVEDQTPEHRDIPLDPGTNKPLSAQPSNIVYEMIRLTTTTKIEGRVSHPYTEVSVRQRDTLLTKTTADRFGIYRVFLDNDKLKSDEDISLFFTKVDLTTYNTTPSPTVTPRSLLPKQSFFSFLLSLLSLKSFAQTITIAPSPGLSLPPIPSNIKGFAYDRNNTALPSTHVSLKLAMNGAVFYETDTDDKGYFVIPAENTPVVPYFLEMRSAGKTSPIVYSTSQFAKKNAALLVKNNANATNEPTQPFFQRSTQQYSNQQLSSSPVPTTKASRSSERSSPVFLIVLLFLLVFILIGLTVFLVVRFRQTNIKEQY